MSKFVNESKPYDHNASWRKDNPNPGSFGFDRAPAFLFLWSRLFQSVISQVGTFFLTGKFHDQQCSIYKTEGGCNMPGAGELVLHKDSCYWDHAYHMNKTEEKKLKKIADLITAVVLKWNPENPIDSMLEAASEFSNIPVADIRAAVEKSSNGGVFGGNALADFFDWNPFSKAPIDREYERFCLTKFDGKTDAEVDQKYADQDLGDKLLVKINAKIKSNKNNGTWASALCCSPRRFKREEGGEEVLNFWINTGRTTVIDYWKTKEQIEEFLAGDGALNDTAKF